jgi:hypothetical protein
VRDDELLERERDLVVLALAIASSILRQVFLLHDKRERLGVRTIRDAQQSENAWSGMIDAELCTAFLYEKAAPAMSRRASSLPMCSIIYVEN